MNISKQVEAYIEGLPTMILNLGMRVLLAMLFFFVGVQLIKFVRKIVVGAMVRAGAETGAVQFLGSFVKAALYVILVFLIASYFGMDAASIVALLGSAGVAIGLAVQGSLSNLAGGVLILLLKPFKVGDYIIESVTNQEGTVSEIQIFYTKLLTGDNRVIVLPNGSLANSSLVNVTASNCIRLDIRVGISYNANIKQAKKVLEDVVKNDPAVMQDKDILVVVDELGDSSVNLLVRCWFKNDDYWDGKWRITEECKYALDEAGIEIPYPQLDVHMKNV